MKPWIGKAQKAHMDTSIIIFLIEKLNSMQNGIRTKIEKYSKWNSVFRLKCGREKHDQHLQSKTNSTVEAFEHSSKKLQLPAKKNTFDLGTRNSI